MKNTKTAQRKDVGALKAFNAAELIESVDDFARQLKSDAVATLRTTTIQLLLPVRGAAEGRAAGSK